MKREPLILGHRGYRKKYPENTLLAFSKAFEYGADGIECDIQKSSDGVYFVFHDHDLERITGYSGKIDETGSEQIRSLEAGKGEKIPDLEAFLDSMPREGFLNIELKEETLSPDDSVIIEKMLRGRGLKENILISSFRHELLPCFKKAGYKTGLLYETYQLEGKLFPFIIDLIKKRPWSVNFPVEFFRKGSSLSFKIMWLILKLFRTRYVFWTEYPEEDFSRVIDFAQSVITDRVEEIIEIRERVGC